MSNEQHTSPADGPVAGGLYDRLQESVAAIRAKLEAAGRHDRPQAALILGSGLGPFAETFEDRFAIDYAEIPHFPVSSVEGHVGRLVFGRVGDTRCVTMQGRVHFYEGYDLSKVTFPLRVMLLLGAQRVVVTNAAGGLGRHLEVGDLVLIRDHLNLFGASPLSGPNDDRLGPRFPDMTYAYDAALRRLAEEAAAASEVELKHGIYAGLFGPAYETPAEIEMLRRLGADLVGMSTVPEVIVANHMGAKVLGISCVTNLAAGSMDEALCHDEVTDVAQRVRGTFESLLSTILRRFND